MWRRPVALLVALTVVACGGEDNGAGGQAEAVEATDATATADGSTDDDPGEDPTDADPAGSQDAPGDDGTADAGLNDEVQELLDELDFGDGGASVVLGDHTYEFALGGTSDPVDGKTYLGVCQELFGAIAGHGYDTRDGGAVTVEFDIPPVDWESYEDGRFETVTPRIKIENDATDEAWVADMALADGFPELAGASQIDEWVSDGTRASGTATFIEIHPYGSPVEGAEPLQGSFELGCAND